MGRRGAGHCDIAQVHATGSPVRRCLSHRGGTCADRTGGRPGTPERPPRAPELTPQGSDGHRDDEEAGGGGAHLDERAAGEGSGRQLGGPAAGESGSSDPAAERGPQHPARVGAGGRRDDPPGSTSGAGRGGHPAGARSSRGGDEGRDRHGNPPGGAAGRGRPLPDDSRATATTQREGPQARKAARGANGRCAATTSGASARLPGPCAAGDSVTMRSARGWKGYTNAKCRMQIAKCRTVLPDGLSRQ